MATVLWIDDDPLLLGLCVGVLEGHGYRVLTASDGAAGLTTAKQERPDVILLDVLMPTMTGFEVCRQLRLDSHLKNTPIILLTVLSDPGVANTGREAGADLTLTKLAHPETILTAIAQVLSERGAPPWIRVVE